MSQQSAISFRHVSKSFGATRALDDLTLEIPAGSLVGLVGRNGAGKSTALRCLLGLQRPSAGEVKVLGHDPTKLSVEAKQRIGYMSDGGLPFLGARPADLFGFCAPLYPRWDRRLEDELCRRFEIPRTTRLGKLSLGQQRTVALALALCPRPDVLVLDEPAANLDAVMRRQFLREVLELVADEGRTVLFSSHNLADVERVADRIALLDEGRLRLFRSMEELRENTRRLRFIFAQEAPLHLELPGALCTRRSGRELLVTVDGFTEEAIAGLERRTGARVEVQPIGLEELFIDLAGPDATERAAA